MKFSFLVVSICLSLLVSDFAWAETHPLIDLRGFWVINLAQSDSFEDKYSKLEQRRETKFRFGLGGGSGRPAVGPRTGKSSEREQQFNIMQQILGAKALHIDGYGDVAVTYDGKITRYLAPNPDGRVFSASGKELVGDEFGLTLSYWDDAVLVVETTTPWGVKLVERFRQTNQATSLVVLVSLAPPGRDPIQWSRVYARRQN